MDAPREDLDRVVIEAVEALGNETRARILHHLRAAGASTRGDIADELNMNAKTLQHHLQLLRRLGVVHMQEKTRSGADWHRHVYERDSARVAELIRALNSSL